MDINLKITVTEAPNGYFNEAMGISMDRAKELGETLIPILQEGNLVTAMVKASEMSTSVNELAFCGIMLGRYIGEMSNPLAGLTAHIQQ